ncbi:MAG: hypothetical protein NTW73_02215 [Candidatus Parcubacteria bacterium]|nr:hypothetical protein [Candidatus Parcubacteria bacterium]
MGIQRDFISDEKRTFKYKIGKILASSLSGFIAGCIFSSLAWYFILYLIHFKQAYELFP